LCNLSFAKIAWQDRYPPSQFGRLGRQVRNRLPARRDPDGGAGESPGEVICFGATAAVCGFAATLFMVWYSQSWPIGAWVTTGFGAAGFSLQILVRWRRDN
jgi:hypothetical protein